MRAKQYQRNDQDAMILGFLLAFQEARAANDHAYMSKLKNAVGHMIFKYALESHGEPGRVVRVYQLDEIVEHTA
eukprot:7810091-Lingulodinium_polyedra.AAC.1